MSRKIRLAWVSTYNSRSGLAAHGDQLLEHFDRRFYDITVIGSRQDPVPPDPANLVRLWPDRSASLPSARDFIGKFDAVFVNFHSSVMEIDEIAEMLKAAQLAGVDTYVTLHRAMDRVIDGRAVGRNQIAEVLRECTRLIVHTEADIARLKALGVVDNVVMIPAGWAAARGYGAVLDGIPELGLNEAPDDDAIRFDRPCSALVEQGDTARDARNWALAARYYRRALARQSGLMPIWVQLGHALKETGDYVEAEAAYRHALALDAGAADTHLQLGHLLKLQRRRVEAIDAYATAVRLAPELVAAREALHAVLGYSPSETERAIMASAAAADPAGAMATAAKPAAGIGAPLTPAERYGGLFADASRKTGSGRDVIWLGVIDWHFRIQRPQHLAAGLADAGARILYVSLVFEAADEMGRFRIVDTPHPGVFEIRMRLAGDPSESVYQGLSEAAIGELQLAIDELIAVLGIEAPIVLVEHPGWHQVACGVAGSTVVYDCLDLATGFSDAPKSLATVEAEMLAAADLVIAASRPLADHLATQRSSIVIRNAAEVDFFARALTDRVAGDRPVIGYFGAIAEWFDIEWIEYCAAASPLWDFRLIGRTDGCDISRAAKLPNVRFYGEKPYQELPLLLRDVDVAIIPFKRTELTRCTNPVKLYEYMAAGKPVVAARMPEVIEATDLAYVADDATSFADRIAQALAEDSPELRARRQAWAREHTWTSRAGQLERAIAASFPLVSVVVLTYDNWEGTKACLFALRSRSDYPSLEIIVVDNASADAAGDKLPGLVRQDDRVQVIRNDKSRGYAAGNNVGLLAARGEYVILLDNNIFVTRGWVRDLLRPMQLDPQIGLTGPVIDDTKSEQKGEWARRFVRGQLRRTSEVDDLASPCVAIRRSVVQTVGLLDEARAAGGLDDYCRRARQANYKLVIAHDVFVHHRHSASFDTHRRWPGAGVADRGADADRWHGAVERIIDHACAGRGPADERGGRSRLAEFAAPWPDLCGIKVEWLPVMMVGRAGERHHAGIGAIPGQTGHLVYGPYVTLDVGDYRVCVRWSAGRPARTVPRFQPVATIEAVSRYGKSYLAQRELRVEDCIRPEHELLFRISGRPPPFPIEVRVWTSGAVPLIVSSITVERIAAPARLEAAR